MRIAGARSPARTGTLPVDGPGDRPDGVPTPADVLDEAAIEAVVSMGDPVERNLVITRGYHALAVAMGDVIGRENANWLCFGQWASVEAGRAIRGESVPSLVRPLIGEEVAAAVAAGNAAVFGDVAPPFIRFIRAFTDNPAAGRDPDAADAVLARLVAHPQLAASPDLRRAFAAYTEALLLRHVARPEAAKRRAERVLVANASVGAHEQVVADPHIRAAIPGDSLLAIAATAHLGIRIPDGVLELGRDVPAPGYLGGPPFPPALLHLEDPEARDLASRFGQDPESARHSDAPNWEDYGERMGFIFTLLRAYQQDAAMFDLPSAR
jgi:hypothetical protein